MTTVAPPPPPPPAGGATPLPPPTLVAPSPDPALLARLQLGTILKATVLEATPPAPPNGLPPIAPPGTPPGSTLIQLQTSEGPMTLAAGLALAKTTGLTLKVVSLVPQLQVQVTTVNGRAAGGGLATPGLEVARGGTPQAGAQAAQPAATGFASGGNASPLQTGNWVTATVLSNTNPAAAKAGAPAAGATGQAPTAGTNTANAPATPAANQSPTAPTHRPGMPFAAPAGQAAARPFFASATPTPGTATPTTSTSAAPMAQGQTVQLPAAGGQIGLRIHGMAAPGANAPTLPAGAVTTSTVITGTVSGGTPGGPTLVDAQGSTLAISAKAPPAEGTRLLMEVTETPPKATTATPTPQASTTDVRAQMFATRNWQALQDALSTLQKTDPQIFQQVTQTILPRPDGNLAANILLFVAALRGGDLKGWLGGDTLRSLERAAPKTAAKLGDEFRQVARGSQDAPGPDGRLVMVPFMAGNQLEQVQMYIRKDKGDGDGDDEPQEKSRLLIDIQLSRLGRMQFDGLLRKEQKRFDLIVRTMGPLSSTMRDDIRQIFADAAAITGIKGAVTFQVTPRFAPIPERAVTQALPNSFDV